MQSLGIKTCPLISATPDPGSQTSFSSRKGLMAATYFQKDLFPVAWPMSFPALPRSREGAEKRQNGLKLVWLRG